jgi:ATP-binding cassette subfamily B protein
MMMEPQRADDIRGVLRRIWGYMRRQRWALVAVFLLVAMSSALGLLGPYLLGRAIDEFILKGDVAGLASNAMLMLGSYLVASLVRIRV